MLAKPARRKRPCEEYGVDACSRLVGHGSNIASRMHCFLRISRPQTCTLPLSDFDSSSETSRPSATTAPRHCRLRFCCTNSSLAPLLDPNLSKEEHGQGELERRGKEKARSPGNRRSVPSGPIDADAGTCMSLHRPGVLFPIFQHVGGRGTRVRSDPTAREALSYLSFLLSFCFTFLTDSVCRQRPARHRPRTALPTLQPQNSPPIPRATPH